MVQQQERRLGMLGATGVGIGAIVGGGILALAGTAFAYTGPSAILVFAANGLLALLTALSFAEMASAFPESGGSYAFARKVFSVETAFTVGWVVWFASIVAGVLYALGFGSFTTVLLGTVFPAEVLPSWLLGRPGVAFWGVGATLFYAVTLVRSSGGGGQWATMGKVLVFMILLVGGLAVLLQRPAGTVREAMQPFFAFGTVGFLSAMGYTFIALQGFDLIAAVGGEVKDPERIIPRAMFLSLAVALAIYLPFLLILTTVGVAPGRTLMEQSAENPASAVVVAVQVFLGPTGFWLVLVAGLLSMLSALHANIYAASRVALAMSRDRTLPNTLSRLHERHSTPVTAIVVSAVAIVGLLLVVGNVAAAGAVSSLIFLLSFSLVHLVTILFRIRMPERPPPFCTPWFPIVPVIGIISCLALAIFQGSVVPEAGRIAVVWLGLGGLLYLFKLAPRARVFDASAQARNPDLVRLRGRSPLVLVPIANPDNAAAMVAIANALAPRGVGRVLLLSVVSHMESFAAEQDLPRLQAAQDVLRESLSASLSAGMKPEALTTLAEEPWGEIARVAEAHRCESLLIGFSRLDEKMVGSRLEQLIGHVECDVVVLRAPTQWSLAQVQKVLVPIGGRGGHDELRARLLSSLQRGGTCLITFLRILPAASSDAECERARRDLVHFAQDEVSGVVEVEVVRDDRVQEEVVRRAVEFDLLVLGLQRQSRRKRVFGRVALEVVRNTSCATVMIGRGD